ncbi:MAG TPA: ribokinase [Anaerolineae bacterium]|nr:ribokinase [Anaerolineae bacterium]HQI84692.1 ribokinase [Anaerolineae bacterium]
MNKPIVVIGSSNIDFIMKMDHLPARDETVVNAVFMQTFGGKGANQAVAAGRAGGNVIFVNCVGDDPYAERMLAGFRESRINTDFIYRDSGISSGTALVMIGEGGHNYLSVAPGANGLLTPERVEAVRDLIADAAYVLMQFEIPPASIAHALDIAAEVGTPVVWNYAPALPFDATQLNKVSIVIANEVEAAALTGIFVADRTSAEAAAQKLRELGAQTAIITLGEAGSVVATGEEVQHIPAFPVEPLDTTAAGDTYCGCLVVALAEGQSLADAVRFASAGGALCVQRMGAQPSIPWRDEIEAFLQARL